ncbi:MAG: hypothetical protein JNK85_08965 [Verrucomicrobiales bacterium]|nr:hypothetical protein [Verrucomicrobiales bacterium]
MSSRLRLFHSSGLSRILLALAALAAPAAIAAMVAAADGGAPADTGSTEGTGQWFDFLGAFHIVALHYPIGFVTGAFLLEAYHFFRPSPEVRRVNRMVLWLALISGITAAVLGLFRGWDDEFDAEMVNMHRNLGFAVVGFTAFAIIAEYLSSRAPSNKGLLHVYRGLVAAAMITLVPAGHYGGNLTHGSDFLTANAPPMLAKLLKRPTKSAESPAATKAEAAEGDALFTQRILPILEAKCYSCHGPEKHKGDYRLDQKESAFKGGESGSTGITPGNLMKSELVRRILLPAEHDEAMPPSGKKPLTPEEILLVAHWVEGGAPFVERAPASGGRAAAPPTPAPAPVSQ